MHKLRRLRISSLALAAFLLLGVGAAAGQSLDDIRITEISEEEQWVEIKNTADGAVDVSDGFLCANIRYAQVGPDLTVFEFDPDGNSDLTLAAGEYLALEWSQVDPDNGDVAFYSQSGFTNPDNIVDYLRWGSSGADREDVAVDAGIWTQGNSVSPAQSGATIAFLDGNPATNDDPADWGEGNPTPAAGNVVLPVELTSFDVVTDGTAALLTWTTASETNNAGFAVQHRKGQSQTESGFAKVGFVDGVGTTTQAQTYEFRLSGLSPGQHAFRLKQVDLDGSVEFGPTVEVSVRVREVSALRPNPAAGPARLTLSVRTRQTVRVELYNVLGQRVRTVFKGPVAPGQVRELVVNGGRLSGGTYFVQIVGEQFRDTRRLVVVE